MWLAIPEEQSPEDGKRRCQKGGEDAISPQFGLQSLSIRFTVWFGGFKELDQQFGLENLKFTQLAGISL